MNFVDISDQFPDAPAKYVNLDLIKLIRIEWVSNYREIEEGWEYEDETELNAVYVVGYFEYDETIDIITGGGTQENSETYIMKLLGNDYQYYKINKNKCITLFKANKHTTHSENFADAKRFLEHLLSNHDEISEESVESDERIREFNERMNREIAEYQRTGKVPPMSQAEKEHIEEMVLAKILRERKE